MEEEIDEGSGGDIQKCRILSDQQSGAGNSKMGQAASLEKVMGRCNMAECIWRQVPMFKGLSLEIGERGTEKPNQLLVETLPAWKQQL